MNGVVVNVRGINASGKSTAVREFCRAYSLQPQEVSFMGQKFRIMTDGVRLVFGWYKPYSGAEGMDALKVDKESFKRFFEYVIKRNKPQIVVYEKIIWSKTFKLTSEIAEIARKNDYQFIAICMMIKFENGLQRLLLRNGGNIERTGTFENGYYGVQNARKNLKKNGYIVFDAGTDYIKKESMKYVIPAALKMFYQGKKEGNIEKVIAGKNE